MALRLVLLLGMIVAAPLPALASAADTVPSPAGFPVVSPLGLPTALPVGPAETGGPVLEPARVAAAEVDDGYATRLLIHRVSAWTTAAVFPVQIYLGTRLIDRNPDPAWVRSTHRAGAYVLGTTFTLNTVTGAWNWWADRETPEGFAWRTAHALVMLTADAAVVGTVIQAQRAKETGDAGTHRTFALSAAGLVALGHLMMLPPFRRD